MLARPHRQSGCRFSLHSTRLPQFGCSCSTTTTSPTFGITRCKSRSIPTMVDDSNTKPPTPAHAPADADAKSPRDGDDHDDESTRKRIASIATRFGGMAAQASSQATQKAADAASQATEQVSKTVSPTAAQTAGVLQAMALSTKNVFSPEQRAKEAKSWYEYESPLHVRRSIAEFESPLHARRRLAAIASQLGLATSSAKQAPGLLSALTSASSASSSSSNSSAGNKWDTARLPDYHELPSHGGWPGCAWDVWGKGDQLGTINLLTESLVLRAAKQEFKPDEPSRSTGQSTSRRAVLCTQGGDAQTVRQGWSRIHGTARCVRCVGAHQESRRSRGR